MVTLAPHYHVGIIVPDIGAARSRFSQQIGVTWGPVLHLDEAEYRDATSRDLVLPTTICYSVEEPRLELIEEVPGSVWVCNDHSNLHHIGFWSDDLPGDSTQLNQVGCPLQLCGRAGDEAPVSFAYHYNEFGVRIEIVDASMRDVIASFLFRPEEH
jgi:hypothetical protein